jgi:hypothetical protein
MSRDGAFTLMITGGFLVLGAIVLMVANGKADLEWEVAMISVGAALYISATRAYRRLDRGVTDQPRARRTPSAS